MNLKISWSPQLETGIGFIDEEHQELFRRIGNLIDACTKGEGKEAVLPLFAFLEQYVVEHFGGEERTMERFAYPDEMTHKAEHGKFIDKLSELRRRLETSGPTVPVVVAINIHVVRWLNDHILRLDRRLGSYLQRNAAWQSQGHQRYRGGVR